jgi:hypothetical protein
VRLGVMLAGFLGMFDGMKVVAVRQMRVVPGLLMLLGAMVLGRLAMMLGGGLVMLGGLLVVAGQLASVHDGILLFGGRLARPAI